MLITFKFVVSFKQNFRLAIWFEWQGGWKVGGEGVMKEPAIACALTLRNGQPTPSSCICKLVWCLLVVEVAPPEGHCSVREWDCIWEPCAVLIYLCTNVILPIAMTLNSKHCTIMLYVVQLDQMSAKGRSFVRLRSRWQFASISRHWTRQWPHVLHIILHSMYNV